jgi:hypothetical protein
MTPVPRVYLSGTLAALTPSSGADATRLCRGWHACADGTPITAEFVIDAYHRLFQIEKSFRMSKHDLAARPIYARKRDSIEAHLNVVFAALAVSRWLEDRTGWSIKKFVRTTRRYRTIQIQAGNHTITAADPLPDDLRDALDRIHTEPTAH